MHPASPIQVPRILSVLFALRWLWTFWWIRFLGWLYPGRLGSLTVDDTLVRLELVLVVDLELRILLRLAQHAVADDEKLDLVAHEAAEGVLGRAHDRLAAHVEACVDQNSAAGLLLEARDQRMETRAGVGVHRLYTRRIVDVSNGGDVGAHDVELVDTEELLLLVGHPPSPRLLHVRDQEHVG